MTKKTNNGIYKRHTTWTAHIHWTDNAANTQQHKRGGFVTKDDAIRYRTKYLSELHSGRRRGTTKLRLGQYLLNEWLPNREGELKPSTFASYANTINSYIVPHLGGIRLEELSVRRVESFYKDLQASGARGCSRPAHSPLSSKTVSNIAGVLNRAYRDAVRWELIASNPISTSIKPSKRSPEMKAWQPEELGRFIDGAQTDRLAAIWHLVATTGMRRGELLGLTWNDVDFGRSKVTIRQTRVRAGNATIDESPKSKASHRVLSIDKKTMRALARWRIQQSADRLAVGEYWPDTAGHVVTELDGQLPDPNTFTRRFKALCKRLELRPIRLHDVRHSYVVAARRAGADLITVSKRIGHADPNVTQAVYDHVFSEDDQDAADSTASLIYARSE